MISTYNAYVGENNPYYIVIHETDNFSPGAGAYRHAYAQSHGHFSDISVHYYVDDVSIYQAMAHQDGAWHIGRSYQPEVENPDATNRNTIGIEICVNPDSDYTKARQNAIDLVRYLILQTKIPSSRVIRHQDAKGKYCPRNMLAAPVLWEDFQRQIGEADQPATPEEGSQTPYTRWVGAVSVNLAHVRTGPGTDYSNIIGYPVLAEGNRVEVTGEANTPTGWLWYQIEIAGRYTGYIHSENLKPAQGIWIGEVWSGDGTANVRIQPGMSAIYSPNPLLGNGNLVEVHGERRAADGSLWYRVWIDGKVGYVYAPLIRLHGEPHQ